MKYLYFFIIICQVASFVPTSRIFSTNKRRSCNENEGLTDLAASTVTSTETLGGVREFESWWTSARGEKNNSEIQSYPHAVFEKGSLRGLEAKDTTKNSYLFSVPRSLCLSVPFDNNWDASLAIQLLKECELGTYSKIYGYCALLCSGVPYKDCCVPPSTAPDALRNWDAQQKARLGSSQMGKKLLELEEMQRKMWLEKYENIDQKNVTFDQFAWAMEAVHSRAFKGLGAKGLENSKIGTFAIQLVAGGVGLFALLDPLTDNGDTIAAVCGAVALAPLIYSFVSGGESTNEGNAVLLPFIDSANHSENADSNIQFDPLKDCFTLSAGKNCFIGDDDSGRTQLFINYGTRSDSELLLNYGFLNEATYGADIRTGDTTSKRDERRKMLAEAFVRANP
mmetsp:Transcript_13503/g.20556  ORF Transcript_13503/g.20556 Transcript_13503/m.20556 type:complete len:395 (-) Transcript_13503:137-1321(-)